MKHSISIFLFILLHIGAVAQNPMSALKEKMDKNLVSLAFEYTVSGKVQCNGTALVQGRMFHTSFNGMDVICDGKTRWTVDREAKEVYVENCSGLEEYMKSIQDFSGINTGKDSISGTCLVNGEKAEFKLEKIKASPATGDCSGFTFDTAEMDSSWVITDLR